MVFFEDSLPPTTNKVCFEGDTYIEELFVVRGVLQRVEELVRAARRRVRAQQRAQRRAHALRQLLQRQRARVLCTAVPYCALPILQR